MSTQSKSASSEGGPTDGGSDYDDGPCPLCEQDYEPSKLYMHLPECPAREEIFEERETA